MAEPTIYLVDVHGPFAGLERPYARTAAENALASGYARRPEAATPVVAPRPEVAVPVAGPEIEPPAPEPSSPPAPVAAPLPKGLRHREILEAAGITTLDAVPRTIEGLVGIDQIGSGRAKDILRDLQRLGA